MHWFYVPKPKTNALIKNGVRGGVDILYIGELDLPQLAASKFKPFYSSAKGVVYRHGLSIRKTVL